MEQSEDACHDFEIFRFVHCSVAIGDALFGEGSDLVGQNPRRFGHLD